MRIVRVRSKVLYFAIALAASFIVDTGVDLVVSPGISLVVNTAITAAIFVGASRSFRGSGEPVEPPRPWWRMTSRPKGSLVLAILSTFSVATAPFLLDGEYGLTLVVSDLALWTFFAILFFISFGRLRSEKPQGSIPPGSAEWRPDTRQRAL